jgi:hypothetical protein
MFLDSLELLCCAVLLSNSRDAKISSSLNAAKAKQNAAAKEREARMSEIKKSSAKGN